MKKYKFGVGVYLVNSIIAIFCIIALSISLVYKLEIIFIFAFAFSLLMTLYGFISILFSYSMVDSTFINQKALFKKVSIPLSEVKYITDQPIGKLAKDSIGIYGKTNKISITSWTWQYKELIKIVIEKCNKNPDIKIDPRVYEIISK